MGVGQLADELLLEGTLGLNVGFEGGDLGFVVGGVLAGEDGVTGEQAVLEGVFDEAALPCSVRGPVDFFALLRLAWICFSVAMRFVSLGFGQGIPQAGGLRRSFAGMLGCPRAAA